MKCVGIGSPERLGKAHLVLSSVGEFTADMLSQLEKADQSK
jgi:hypothetical protein